MQFNHVANRVNPDRFDTVVALFTTRLGFTILRRTDRAIWLRQPGATVDLQLSRSDPGTRDADKARSQVAFLSDTPQADLQSLADWLATQGLESSVGAYSDREFYLDAPAAFVDFVIEAMRPELAEYEVS